MINLYEAYGQHPHDPNYKDTPLDKDYQTIQDYDKELIEAALNNIL